MNLTKRVGLIAGAAALALTGVSAGENTPDTSNDELRGRVAELEQKLAELQARNDSNWLTERRANEIRSLVHDVLADADTRASLLQGGGTGGWDNGFFLASADGNHRLNVGGQIQFRYVFNHQDDAGSSDSSRGGFENSRTKLTFWGNAFGPEWTYKVQGNFSRGGGSFGLEDAWINYDFGNGWGVKVGQFKGQLLREEIVDSRYQQAVERSLVNGAFTMDFVQGVMVHYSGDQFRFSGSFHDGAGMANTTALTEDTEYAFTARGEFMIGDDWSAFDDFASWQGEGATNILIGGAINFQEDEYGTVSGPEAETLTLTLDGTVEFGGANIFGAFVYRDVDADGVMDTSPWGFVLQGGLMLTEDIEAFGRFEYGDSDIASLDDLSILTFGATKFFNGHNNKWTTDIGIAFEEVDSFWGGSSDADLAGYRIDAPRNDTQVVIRTQWQLLF